MVGIGRFWNLTKIRLNIETDFPLKPTKMSFILIRSNSISPKGWPL